MDFASLTDHVEGDGLRLASVALDRLERPAPSCPGWRVRDVVTHLAEVYEHKIACTELGAMPDPWPPAWPAGRDPVEWLGDAHRRLLDTLRTRGPAARSATWWPADQTVGFWGRRMAHETVVHRVDAEQAAADVTAVDPDLALDGVDEVLTRFLPGDWSEAPDQGGEQVVAVVAAGRTWTALLQPARADVAGGSSVPAAATVAGAPAPLMLWLWGRAADDRVTFEGDPAAVRRLRARLVLATQ